MAQSNGLVWPRQVDQPSCKRKVSPRLIFTLALLGSLLAAGVFSPAAPATNDVYCYGWIMPPYTHCDGPRHSLTANQAYNYYGASFRVCAGAVDTNGNFYGSYACGYAFAQHCYSGSNLLYPRIHNGDSRQQTMYGRWFYNEQCP
jgi:hypothetical protein